MRGSLLILTEIPSTLLLGGRFSVRDVADMYMKPYNVYEAGIPIKVPCGCIGSQAYAECSAEAVRLLGVRSPFETLHDLWESLPEETRPEWPQVMSASICLTEDLVAGHPAGNSVDPDCEDCAGTGWDYDTQNPRGKWSHYSVGGAYTGMLAYQDGFNPRADKSNFNACDVCRGTGKRMDSIGVSLRADNPDFECNGCLGKRTVFEEDPRHWHDVPRNGNVRPVSELQLKLYTDAVIDRKGNWIERGKLSQEDWYVLFYETLRSHNDCTAIVIEYNY